MEGWNGDLTEVEMPLHSNHGDWTGPNSIVEKSKYFNILDEAFLMLCLNISRDLLFHVEILTTPNKFWLNLESLFGKIDDTRGHQLEI